MDALKRNGNVHALILTASYPGISSYLEVDVGAVGDDLPVAGVHLETAEESEVDALPDPRPGGHLDGHPGLQDDRVVLAKLDGKRVLLDAELGPAACEEMFDHSLITYSDRAMGH